MEEQIIEWQTMLHGVIHSDGTLFFYSSKRKAILASKVNIAKCIFNANYIIKPSGKIAKNVDNVSYEIIVNMIADFDIIKHINL